MSALGAALLMFATFTILGLGVTALFPASYPADRRVRIAPGVGIGLYVVTTLILSRSGLPVRSFATPLTIALLVASAAALVWRPLRVGWQTLVGILVPVVAACVLVGSPLLTFGFHWVSYANDDMTNYSLSAQRFQDNGYYTIPHAADYLNERDLSEAYYGLDVAHKERTGSNLLLAVAATEFGRNTFEIFMPFIFAAFLTVVVGAGALVFTPGGRLLPALISFGVAVSPLASFGTYYQLLGQEYGLATCCSLLGMFSVFKNVGRKKTEFIGTALALSIAACGLLAIYPEFVPFVGLAGVLWLVLRRRDFDLTRAFGLSASAIAGIVVFLNGYALNMFVLIVRRVIPASRTTAQYREFQSLIFPFYLVPSGLDNLWGIQPIGVLYRDPDQSILILLGILLTLMTCVATGILLVFCDTIAAPMLAALMGYAAFAAFDQQGFPLYKLAMYAQPFMIATLFGAAAHLAGRLPRGVPVLRRAFTIAPALLALVLWIPTLSYYREASMDRHSGLGVAFEEIKGASVDRILLQLRAFEKKTSQPVISDTFNVSLAKIEAGYLRNTSLFFASNNFLANLTISDRSPNPGDDSRPLSRALAHLQRERDREFRREFFNFTPGSPSETTARFVEDQRIDDPRRGSMLYLTTDHDLSVLNRRTFRTEDSGLSIGTQNAATNRLIFVSSSLGFAASGSDRSKIGLYQLEPDFYFHGKTMSSAGRYLLFRLNRPSASVRLVLEVSSSLNNDGANQVPDAKAVGTTVASFHSIGSGSGRLLSDPIKPVIIGHAAFVGLDLGSRRTSFEQKRTGLMLLYGRSTRFDARSVVGFVRDISAIPASQIPSGTPTEISRFPADLESNELFYSGIYEDGWFGRDVRLRLRAAGKDPRLYVRLVVPRIADANFSTSVTISIDGATRGTWPCPLGASEISAPTSLAAGPHDIELHFSDVQALPGLDRRPVSAAVTSIGFE